MSDYKGSGYDRGHLAPAQDMKASNQIMSESFLLSNMSPQLPAFNRGGNWRRLEDAIHSWGPDNVIVITGPIFKNNLGKIGSNKVTIPGYFYKVIYSQKDGEMIGFILPHNKNKKELLEYAVSVNVVESLTGIDFFPQLEDSIEEKLESKYAITKWSFKKSSSKSSSSSKETVSNQCRGTAKSTGSQCKNKTTYSNGYCYAHQSQSPDYVKPKPSSYVGRCNATTKKGTRCKRNASSGSRYCWQH